LTQSPQQALSLATSAVSAPDGGYDPFFFDSLAGIEDQHFWFRARNRLIFRLTRKLAKDWRSDASVLEVGCGTGNTLRVLRQACPLATVIGLELWLEGLRHAQKRTSAMLVQGDVRDFPFSKPFDLICLFDVLEHVPDEHSVLVSLQKNLAPGGRLLLTVPAHQFLWSYFDEAAHHCRRYSAPGIRDTLRQAGFKIEFLSYFMASIFPLVWLVRKLRRNVDPNGATNSPRALSSDEFRIVPVVNQLLTLLLTMEVFWVAQCHHLPFGTSLVVVAEKPR
jgi:SAM-dependent methyltransferase